MDIFSARLKWVREKMGISQKEVAEQIGMSPQGYGKIENAQREPNLESLVKISLLFGESIDFLTGVTDLDITAYEMLETAASIQSMMTRNLEAMERMSLETDSEKYYRFHKVVEVMERDYRIVKDKLDNYIAGIPYFSFNAISDNDISLFYEKQKGKIRERFLRAPSTKKDT